MPEEILCHVIIDTVTLGTRAPPTATFTASHYMPMRRNSNALIKMIARKNTDNTAIAPHTAFN